jgi:hypothetical protein
MQDEQLTACHEAAKAVEGDVFAYNSEMVGTRDYEMINLIAAAKRHDRALLVLTTNGGDPDTAYRIARYFQENYEHLTVLVAGRCKSAGTLIALAATDLAFMPYGELGPLDIQMAKVDKFDHAQSGLTIQDALNTLESRATQSFFEMVSSYMEANQGLLSFQTAAKAASDFITQLYAPILSRIDPEEVGARSRAMKIADDYGKRLSLKWQNVKPGAVARLAETYSSHSFVIDCREAAELFHRVRHATDNERKLVETMGLYARFQLPRDEKALHAFHPLSDIDAKEQGDGNTGQQGGPHNGGNPEEAGGTTEPEAPPQSGILRSVQPSSG